MQDIFIISSISLLASILTFFSGFGLGTILLPVFGLFFQMEIAIAATGIVHLGNNLFKLGLVGKNIDLKLLVKFGIPSICGAILGAFILKLISSTPELFHYTLFSLDLHVHTVNLIISILMIGFAFMELLPILSKLNVSQKRWMIPGGIISGFFGGLSGHQGALRSLFLIKFIQKKEVYIATGTAIACSVDLSRIPVYFSSDMLRNHSIPWSHIFIPMLFAFVGAVIGTQLLKKITINLVQKIVAIGIIIFALGLGSGFINVLTGK